MLVDLLCMVDCHQPIHGERPIFVAQGQEIKGVEVSGNEGWLKYFNAYAHDKPVEKEEVGRKLINSFDVAEEKEELTPQDIGAGASISLETIKEAFTKKELVAMLHEAGQKSANTGWKEETLAKKVQEAQLYVGKL